MKAIFIGECMVELTHNENGGYNRSFAGDTFNSAVYMKRVMGDQCDASFLSVVGADQLSKDMENFIKAEDINTDTLLKTSDGTVGLYIISTDDTGERTFSYWRQNAVARQLMNVMEDRNLTLNGYGADLIFFSGISLAILDSVSRKELLDQLKSAREKGAKIAFDTNYRPKLWENVQTAGSWIDQAYSISDYIFPGLDEEGEIFQVSSLDECLERLSKITTAEIILKAGDDGMYVKTGDQITHREFICAENTIDTTAAGDSFDGGYLAMRFMGGDPAQSLEKGSDVAAIVVSYPGALIPKDAL